MNTVVINIKTDKNIKTEVQKVANELGISVSALINGYLRQVVRSQKVIFTIDEKPSKDLIEAIRQARKERKEGKSSPVFDNAEDAIKWLNI
ncbi:MAG: RelB/DinJ family addiction module antitoxin [Parcubacteria group bacterium GW2011_GWC1_38_6]|nr:MAG: RelB/DinJ family addiction module antitoxin [Parcubacteria group bacterium GW2011_GWC1_38_6]